MTTKSFKRPVKTAKEYVSEIYSIIGSEFPLSISVIDGKITEATYKTEWTEGGTTPVTEEVEEEYVKNVPVVVVKKVKIPGSEFTKNGKKMIKTRKIRKLAMKGVKSVRKVPKITRYEKNSVKKSLDGKQIDTIDNWIKDNLYEKS